MQSIHYHVHLNDNLNETLVDSNPDEEILLDVSGIPDDEVLDKQNLRSCDHSENHLNEEYKIELEPYDRMLHLKWHF